MLTALNPLSKLMVALAWLVAAAVIFDARLQLAAILIASVALIVLNRTSPLFILTLMVPFALFGLGFLSTSLLFHRESDFALWLQGSSALSSAAASAGITLFLRAIALGMISAFFALTTDPGQFVRALMAHMRLPPRIGYALFAALQMIPDLATEAQQIRLARAMRRGRPPRRIPGPFELPGLVIPLLAFAIRRAGRTAIAMEARGFVPHAPRSLSDVPDFHARDGIFAAIGLGLLASVVAVLNR